MGVVWLVHVHGVGWVGLFTAVVCGLCYRGMSGLYEFVFGLGRSGCCGRSGLAGLVLIRSWSSWVVVVVGVIWVVVVVGHGCVWSVWVRVRVFWSGRVWHICWSGLDFSGAIFRGHKMFHLWLGGWSAGTFIEKLKIFFSPFHCHGGVGGWFSLR